MDTTSLLAEAVKLDELCRKVGTAYVRGELRGVFGSVFCDFGESFTVLDQDGGHPICMILPSAHRIDLAGGGTFPRCESIHEEYLPWAEPPWGSS